MLTQILLCKQMIIQDFVALGRCGRKGHYEIW